MAGRNRKVRVAVTGLSQSGKSTFITSLVNQLTEAENVRQWEYFAPAKKLGFESAVRVTEEDNRLEQKGEARAFRYKKHLEDLNREPPGWPESTDDISYVKLTLPYRKDPSEPAGARSLTLELMDYPGEWLLDVALLNQTYLQWCINCTKQFQELPYSVYMRDWMQELKATLDPAQQYNTDLAEQLEGLARSYRAAMRACKDKGLHILQPGHFLIPGGDDPDTKSYFQFFPLVGLSVRELRVLEMGKGNVFKKLNSRYKEFVKKKVRRFYSAHFKKIDRQLVLVDCLNILQNGPRYFHDHIDTISRILNNFSYGERNPIMRLFSPSIDRLVFAATKCDHVFVDQYGNLKELLREIVREAESGEIQKSQIRIDYEVISSVRCTRQVVVKEDGADCKYLLGKVDGEEKGVPRTPADAEVHGESGKSITNDVPHPKEVDWDRCIYHYTRFDPVRPDAVRGQPDQQIHLDVVLDLLISDLFR